MTDTDAATPLAIPSENAADTRAIGAALGRLARPGDVLLLAGELGAGKTTFAQGFVAGAESAEAVTSPTFVLVNQYQGRLTMYHADLYRLDDSAEVEALQLSEASLDGVLLVEWPERGERCLPAEHLRVQIAYDGRDARLLTFTAAGARAADLLASLAPVIRR